MYAKREYFHDKIDRYLGGKICSQKHHCIDISLLE